MQALHACIEPCPAAAEMAQCAVQVLQTNKRISKAGKTVWTHTKRQTGRALGPPKALLARLHGGSQDAGDDSDDDVEGLSLDNYRFLAPAISRLNSALLIAVGA